jgi:acetyl-CoA carboxylase biotin carboxyl carrier protein
MGNGVSGVTLSIADIQEVLKIFLDSEMQDLRLEIGDVRLAVSKSGGAGTAPLAPGPATLPRSTPAADVARTLAPTPAPASAEGREGWVEVASPSVGVFYRRPAPDQPSFVEVGSIVAAGDPVCLIEIMKMFAGVPAPCAGRIAEIAVDDATMVEYGQPVMYIEPL